MVFPVPDMDGGLDRDCVMLRLNWKTLHLPLVVVLLSLHALRCLFLFDPASGVLSNDPPVTEDYAYHYAIASIGSHHFANTGRFWGYDPHFMAGWLDPPATASTFPLKVVAAIVGPSRLAMTIRLLAFLSAALGPVLVVLAGRFFGVRGWELTVTVALVLLYWWIGQPHRMMKWGMFLYVLCVFLVLLVHSLLWALLQHPRNSTAFFLALCISLSVWVHGAALLLLFVPLTVLSLTHLKRRIKWLVFVGLCSLLGLAFTLHNILYMTWYFVHNGYLLSTRLGIVFQGIAHPLAPLLDLIQYRRIINAPEEAGRAALEICLYLLSIRWLLLKMRSKTWTVLDTSIVSTALALFVMCFYGNLIPVLKDLQLYRAKTTLFLYLAVLAGPSLMHLIKHAPSRPFHKVFFWLVPVALGLSVALWNVQRVLGTWRPIDGAMPEDAVELTTWIHENTDATARILVEESGYLDNEGTGTLKYFGGYYPALIPFLTKREILGGPHPYIGGPLPGPVYIIPSGHTTFADGYLFRKDVSEIGKPYFHQMLRLYNIKWILCWSAKGHRFLSAQENHVRWRDRVGHFDIYAVERQGNFFLKGQGTLRAETDLIILSNLRPEEGEVILAYHWFDVLTTTPPCPMDGVSQPLPLVDDPLPFIRIQDPPSQLIIHTNGYNVNALRHAP